MKSLFRILVLFSLVSQCISCFVAKRSPFDTTTPTGALSAILSNMSAPIQEVPKTFIKGELDPTFGNNGRVVHNYTGINFDTIKVDSQNRIVLGGYANNDVLIARLEPNGSLDTSFANNGYFSYDYSSGSDFIYNLQILENDSIFGAGILGYGYPNSQYNFGSLWLNQNGTLNTSYGTNGVQITDFNDFSVANGAVILNDKIILAGNREQSGIANVALAAYHLNGNSFTSFGNSGTKVIDVETGKHSKAYEILSLPNGNLLLLVTTTNPNFPPYSNLALVQLTPNGDLVSSFGNGGIVITDIDNAETARSFAIQKDGKIVVSGMHSQQTDYLPSKCLFLRYNSNGSLDSSFGNNGVVSLAEGTDCKIYQILLQEDGKILGSGIILDPLQAKVFLVRLKADGSLDEEFGVNGKFIGTEIGEFASGMQFTKDGKLLLSGYNINNDQFVVYRIR